MKMYVILGFPTSHDVRAEAAALGSDMEGIRDSISCLNSRIVAIPPVNAPVPA